MSIRSYRPSDREAVREICAATGWMGEFDLKRIADEWIWAEYWTRYFTDVDPLFTWVIDRRGVGQVVDYLTGLPDVRCFERYTRRIIPGIVRRVIRGRLMRRADSRGAILGMLRSLLRGEARVPEAVRARYPATCHFNLLTDARGMGFGGRLLETFLDRVRSLRVPGVHVQTLNLNAAAVRLLERTGFRLAFRRRTTAYAHIDQRRIEIHTWVRAL